MSEEEKVVAPVEADEEKPNEEEKQDVVDQKEANDPIDLEEDDDFADSVKIVPPAPKEEEKAPEPEPEPEPELEPEPENYDYSTPDLSHIEEERKKFLGTYRKANRTRTIISIGVLLIILAGWIVPTFIEALKSASLIIALIIVGVSVAGLALMSFLFKRKTTAWIHDYFVTYYESTYRYVMMEGPYDKFHGDLDLKLTEEEFRGSNLYQNVYKVGSRYGATFEYDGLEAHIIDCAAQTRGAKALETIFVGKCIRTPNTYTGKGLYLYFKGNSRAIPPNGIPNKNVLEETKEHVYYGDPSEKGYLTHEIKEALKKISTDRVLVDVAISIQPGKTYFMLGYEDSLMVVPMEKPFNAHPTEVFSENMATILPIAKLFNK